MAGGYDPDAHRREVERVRTLQEPFVARAEAVALHYGVAAMPIRLHVTRMNGGLDYGPLRYGATFACIRGFSANRAGALRAGDTLEYQGYDCFPYDDGLRLYVDAAATSVLEFEGISPCGEGEIDQEFRRDPMRWLAPHPARSGRAEAIRKLCREIETLRVRCDRETRNPHRDD